MTFDGTSNQQTLNVVRFKPTAGAAAVDIVSELQSSPAGSSQSIGGGFSNPTSLQSSFTVSDVNEVYRLSGSVPLFVNSTNSSTHAVEIAFFVDGVQGRTQTFELQAQNPVNGDFSQFNFDVEDFIQFGSTGGHTVDIRVRSIADFGVTFV